MDGNPGLLALIEATELVDNVSAELRTRLSQSQSIGPAEHAQILTETSVTIEAFRMAVHQALDRPTSP